jgi:uncharacterized spore protein YtfJ
MEAIDHLVGVVLSHLTDAATSSVVAGEPIELGDVTVVVLSSLSLGMGAAGGQGSGKRNETPKKGAATGGPGGGLGEGAGGGVKVRPAAVIAFLPDKVEVLTIPDQPGVFDKMVERVPEVVDMVDRARRSVEA